MPYSLSPVEIHKFSLVNQPQLHYFNPNIPISRHKFAAIRCCNERVSTDQFRLQKDYYELLGVSINSTTQDIKEAYRKLQKKHHPDIAGQKGHEYTMMLNEAYRVLMRKDLRRAYDTSSERLRRKNAYVGYSSWKGPERPQALFVDENACIGCRECVHHAGNTFIMDEEFGCSRVKFQYGDNQQKLEVSVDSCPVNCIYWVDKEELAVLEFLMHPQPKEGYGVFGNGWVKPSNVFAAAKSFNKQLERQATANEAVDEETPAQAEARDKASAKLENEGFSGFWRFLQGFGINISKVE